MATRSVCGKTVSYSLSVSMHVWTLRSPRFAARWNETAVTLLFYRATHAKRLEASEPSDLAEREHAAIPISKHLEPNAIRPSEELAGNKVLRFAEVSARSVRAAKRGDGRDREIFGISLVNPALCSDN